MIFRSIRTILITIVLYVNSALADPFLYSPTKFRFHPHENQFDGFGVQVWNEVTPSPTTGVVVKYHMESSSYCTPSSQCSTGSCFTSSSTNQSYIESLVGLGDSTRWLPRCPSSGNSGNSFAAISKYPSFGYYGIGLWTDARGAQYGNQFVPQSSTDIGAIYVEFPTGAIPNATMRPFTGTCDWASDPTCESQVRMRVKSTQGVAQVNVQSLSQAQQKASVVLRNTASSENHRIEFSVQTLCATGTPNGLGCDENANANYYLSNSTQNRPWIGLRLKGANGTPTNFVTSCKSHPVLESYGEITQAGPFTEHTFVYEISWENFVKTLRHITCLRFNDPEIDGSNNSDVAQIFGTGWSLPENWELLNVLYGQEVANEYSVEEASVGGHLSMFEVKAIPTPPGC